MVRARAILVILLLPLVAGGCNLLGWLGTGTYTFQPGGRSSEAVDYNPSQGLTPANSDGYMNGESLGGRH